MLPEGYKPVLDLIETEQAIKYIKDLFELKLSKALSLMRVSAPLFVINSSGLNDDLSGVERAVSFDIKETGEIAEVVHSLAKWKRFALHRYNVPAHTGIYTDMNAIRRDEITDNIHSLYVDQWDWEKVIERPDRTISFLKKTVRAIYRTIYNVNLAVIKRYPKLTMTLPKEISFITTQQLENLYPDLKPSDRETAYVKEKGAMFLMQIGGKLKSGEKHDGRAPDYDDWKLNGDIVVYYPMLDRACELSSMGIRVDEKSLVSQLKAAGTLGRLEYPFHKALLEGKLPLTVGGGIGQSRLCMLMLQKAHIGEVQSSVWPDKLVTTFEERNIPLL